MNTRGKRQVENDGQATDQVWGRHAVVKAGV
jgi:hypothetical protein